MEIKIKTLTGKITKINIDENILVKQIKNKLQELEGIEPDQQRIIFNGKVLNDETILNISELKSDSILHLILALRG